MNAGEPRDGDTPHQWAEIEPLPGKALVESLYVSDGPEAYLVTDTLVFLDDWV